MLGEACLTYASEQVTRTEGSQAYVCGRMLTYAGV